MAEAAGEGGSCINYPSSIHCRFHVGSTDGNGGDCGLLYTAGFHVGSTAGMVETVGCYTGRIPQRGELGGCIAEFNFNRPPKQEVCPDL